MSLSTGVTLKWSPTVAVSAGTDLAFVPDGQAGSDQLLLICSADTNILLRRTFLASRILPTQPAKVGQRGRLAKSRLILAQPFVAADGLTYVTGIRSELTFHPEQAESVRTDMVKTGSAVLMNAAVQDLLIKLVLG